MEYREIVAVTGLGGLFHLLATKSDGAIVRNLADNTTKFISARLHNVTPLESIEIYTISDNVRLHQVLGAIKASELTMPDAKKAGNDEIRTYFKTVFPDIDEERVYTSDMKKMLKWYSLLEQNNLLDFSAYDQSQESEAAAEDVSAPVIETTEEKPAKKAKAKKEDAETVTATEDAPAKKSTRKKKEETVVEGAEEPKKTRAKKKKEEE